MNNLAPWTLGQQDRAAAGRSQAHPRPVIATAGSLDRTRARAWQPHRDKEQKGQNDAQQQQQASEKQQAERKRQAETQQQQEQQQQQRQREVQLQQKASEKQQAERKRQVQTQQERQAECERQAVLNHQDPSQCKSETLPKAPPGNPNRDKNSK